MTTVTKSTTLPELRTIVEDAERMDRVTFDPQDGSAKFTYEGDRMVFRHGQNEYGITGPAYRFLTRKLGIPSAYLKRTPHELMVPHVNHWLHNAPILTYGVSDDGVVKLVSPGAGQPIGVGKVLDAIESMPEFEDRQIDVHHVSHDLMRSTFSLTTRDRQQTAESLVGEALQTGVTVDTSYSGASPLSIAAYVQRLICTNGMISTDNVYRHTRRKGGEEDWNEWIRVSLQDAMAAGDVELESLSRLQQLTFNGHLSDALASVFVEYGVPAGQQAMIRDAVIDSSPETMYDLLNIVTDLASNDEDVLANGDLSRRLMAIGGSIAAHPELCESCHRVMA